MKQHYCEICGEKADDWIIADDIGSKLYICGSHDCIIKAEKLLRESEIEMAYEKS